VPTWYPPGAHRYRTKSYPCGRSNPNPPRGPCVGSDFFAAVVVATSHVLKFVSVSAGMESVGGVVVVITLKSVDWVQTKA